jgi:hypothetical protein
MHAPNHEQAAPSSKQRPIGPAIAVATIDKVTEAAMDLKIAVPAKPDATSSAKNATIVSGDASDSFQRTA